MLPEMGAACTRHARAARAFAAATLVSAATLAAPSCTSAVSELASGCPDGTLLCAGACVAAPSGICPCAAGSKPCKNGCVPLDEPAFGCSLESCDPCPLGANARVGCANGTCAIAGCNEGFADCDKDLESGCETSLLTSPLHCGACDNPCTGKSATAWKCVAGSCAVETCATGFADCDGDGSNGCEINVKLDQLDGGTNCGACGHDCVGGACQSGVCRPTDMGLVAGSLILDIEVDASDLYLADNKKNAIFRLPKLFTPKGVDRAPPLGTVVANAKNVSGLALAGAELYWTQWGPDAIRKVQKNASDVPADQGTPVVPLDALGAQPQAIDTPTDVEIDGTSLYWVNFRFGPPAQDWHGLFRMDLATSKSVLLESPCQPVCNDQGPLPVAVAVNASNLYWTDFRAAGMGGAVRRATKGDPPMIKTPQPWEAPAFIAATDELVFWTAGSQILVAATDFSFVAKLAEVTGFLTGVAIDTDAKVAYWVETQGLLSPPSRLWRMALPPGP
jgi:hypothetical protein